MVYILERERAIKTISLRKRGQRHGVKLINVASVREYLKGLMESAAESVGNQEQQPT